MIINNDRILKNSDTIFKSQVVDSYLRTTTSGDVRISTQTTGLTTTNSFSGYYQTPSETIKCTDTTDPSTYFNFPATSETSEKKLYFCGNLDAIRCFYPSQTTYDNYFTGDLVCLINEFPNIECFKGSNWYSKYDSSTVTNASFPRNLEDFQLCDCWVSGDIGTTTGLEKLKNVEWKYVNFNGNFHDIKTTSLERTYFRNTPTNFKVNLNCLIDNNPNYTQSCLSTVYGAELNANTVDVSNLETICWNTRYTDVDGVVDNWVFNTGLTSIELVACVGGDMTNWNIPNTEITRFIVCDTSYGNCNLGGSLSGWTFPNEIIQIGVGYVSDLTSMPSDYSNTSLNNFNIQRALSLSGDVTTWIFPSGQTYFNFSVYDTALCGNLENLDIYSGATLSLRRSCFTGNVANINYPAGSSSLNYECNYLNGNIANITVNSNVTSYINFAGNSNTCFDLTSTSFDTCNGRYLVLDDITCIDGDLSNLTVGNNLTYFCARSTPIYSDLCNLNLNNITRLNLYNSSLSQDITSLLTGTTNLDTACLYNNPNLSGDTTNWEVDDIRYLNLGTTSLSGRLSHACPYCLGIQNSDICSCIDVDFDFSEQGYSFDAYNSCIQGHLSGVTLNYSCVYRFSVYSNINIFGSNEFVDNIFVNRKNFSRSYVYLSIQSIGDNVSGTSETLGDLGTYSGDENDLTEAEVNNLVAGTDYDGNGTNTPWDNKEKVYWMKNALVSSSSTSRRYSNFQIYYS